MYGLSIIPAISLLIFLKASIVNVPFWDQFELIPIIQHINEGTFGFNDLWQQHNEHRLLFPRIVMVTLAVLTQWDVRWEIIASWSVAVLSFGLILFLVLRTFKALKKTAPLFLPVLLSFIFFSVVQYDNWLWGWQVQWFINVFGVLLTITGLYNLVRTPKSWLALGATAGGAVLAQYSLGNGTLLWPIIIVTLVYLGIQKWRVVGVGALGVLTTILYYTNYSNPPGSVSKTLFLKEPVQFVEYIGLYFGRPLSYIPPLTAILGALLVGLFVALGIYLFVKHKDRFKQGLPWLALGLYALGGGLITAISRLGYGINQAMSSRYTTISLLLLISVIILIVLNRDLIRRMLKKAYIPVAVALIVFVGTLVVTNAQHAETKAQVQIQYLKDIKRCTSQPEPYDICYLSAYPNKEKSERLIDYLKTIHWGGY
jgi:hypothetical protein